MKNVLDALVAAGGRPLFVGGCVRDELLNVESKDVDVEVYGLPLETLVDVLRPFGKVSEVGKSFGVVKLTTVDGDFDFTLPRLDNKSGTGHKGFDCVVDHTLTPKESAARRDFTMNSVAKTVDGVLVDPFDGAADLRDRVLRATGPAFAEDPLRVLRGFQFAGRFEMTVEADTADMCRGLSGEFHDLPLERVSAEFLKWATKSVKPSMGLDFLKTVGWLELFPELFALVGVQQDPEWHPEGDVWAHTCMVVDEAADLANRDNLNDHDRTVLVLAALCHDLGKATTTAFTDGRWRAPGHASAGADLTESFLLSVGLHQFVNEVVPLVVEHMAHCASDMSPRTVRRLANRVHPATVEQLARVVEADHSGRSPLPKGLPDAAKTMLVLSRELAVNNAKPKPVLMGRHLVELGHKPGPNFKVLLDRAFAAQLDGEFSDVSGALRFLSL